MDEVYNLAIEMGIPEAQARLAAAQSALETGYGRHAPGNAYFGMKAGSSWEGPTQKLRTHEEENGALVAINDEFRVYDNKAASLADWYDRLKVRWPDAAAATTFEDAVNGLKIGQEGAYATDSKYKSKLANIASGMTPRPPGNIPNGTHSNVSAYQQQLKSRGFDPGTIDGINGPRTKAAVKAFQQANGLTVDGIVGPQTLAALAAQDNRPQTQRQPQPSPRESLLPDFSNMPPRASFWQEAGGLPGTTTQVTAADTRAEQRTLGGQSPVGSVLGFKPLPAPAPLAPEAGYTAPSGTPSPSASALSPVASPAPTPSFRVPIIQGATSGAPQPAIGSVLGGLGNALGQGMNFLGNKAQEAAGTLGTTANNVVEGTKVALGNTAEAAKAQLADELLGTVKGRTLLLNTAMGIPPRRDAAADRRNSAPEGFGYGSTGKKLYKIGQTYQSSRGPVVFNGSGFQPVGVKTEISVTPPPRTGGSTTVGSTGSTTLYGGPNVVDEVGALRYHG